MACVLISLDYLIDELNSYPEQIHLQANTSIRFIISSNSKALSVTLYVSGSVAY